MAAIVRLNRIWRSNTISFSSKVKLYKSLIVSIFFCSCETWTLFVDCKKKILVFETKCLRKLFRISHLGYETNDWVRSKIIFLVDPQEPFLATVKRQKLA